MSAPFRSVFVALLTARVLHHGNGAQLVSALHSVLRQLNLDLKGITGDGIAPVIRLDETGRGCGGHDGTGNVRHAQAELSGAFAIDGDVECGIVQFLGALKIAQERQLGHLRLYFQGVAGIILKTDALYGNLDRCRRSETHHLADDVAGFE